MEWFYAHFVIRRLIYLQQLAHDWISEVPFSHFYSFIYLFCSSWQTVIYIMTCLHTEELDRQWGLKNLKWSHGAVVTGSVIRVVVIMSSRPADFYWNYTSLHNRPGLVSRLIERTYVRSASYIRQTSLLVLCDWRLMLSTLNCTTLADWLIEVTALVPGDLRRCLSLKQMGFDGSVLMALSWPTAAKTSENYRHNKQFICALCILLLHCDFASCIWLSLYFLIMALHKYIYPELL